MLAASRFVSYEEMQSDYLMNAMYAYFVIIKYVWNWEIIIFIYCRLYRREIVSTIVWSVY